jgi:hypothetical protein
LARLRREIIGEFHHVARKLLRIGGQISPQRLRRPLIRSRGSSQAEIDAPRVQRLERAELLRDHQWRMVRQHDPPGPHPDGRRAARDMADQHGGRRAGDSGHAVVFREPKASVSPTFGVSRQVERVSERLGGVAPECNGRKIEDGIRGHRRQYGGKIGQLNVSAAVRTR